MSKRIIVWFRNDLRVRDNPALLAATRSRHMVLPLFVVGSELSGKGWAAKSMAVRRFWAQALLGLEYEIAKLGGTLVVRYGEPEYELIRVVEAIGADAVYTCETIDPFSSTREMYLMDQLLSMGIEFKTFPENTLFGPEDLLDHKQRPYTNFNSYYRAWQSTKKPAPAFKTYRMNTPAEASKLTQPITPSAFGLAEGVELRRGGESRAHAIWLNFVRGRIYEYTNPIQDVIQRNTSTISPYLAAGCISPKMLMGTLSSVASQGMTEHAAKCINAVRRSLALLDFCHMRWLWEARIREYASSAICKSAEEFDLTATEAARFRAWVLGNTGVPIVDAAMREIATMGWTSHLLREVVASFLTNLLKLDASLGLWYFSRALSDFDAAISTMHWMTLSGQMTGLPHRSAASLHPLRVSARLDPTGEFVASYIPKLVSLPMPYRHTPWRNPIMIASKYNFRVGKHYPKPIVPMP